MLTALMAAVFVATPVKVAVPGFTFVGIEKQLGEVFLDRFVNVIAQSGQLTVTTASDVQQVLGLERQKQLLGCEATSASCLAELAGALGVDAILTGSLAKSGGGYTVNIRVVKAGSGAALVAATERVNSESALQDWLDTQARSLPGHLRAALGVPEPVTTAIKATGSGVAPVVRWVPGMVGIGAAVAGGVLFGLSKGDAAKLRAGGFSDGEAIVEVVHAGQAKETAGLLLMGGGGAAIAASLIWVLAGGSTSAVEVTVVPSTSGVVLGLSGGFP